MGAVESVKLTCSGFMIFVCVSSDQRERALRVTQLASISVSCFALKSRVPLMKGVISGVCTDGAVELEDSWCLWCPPLGETQTWW